MILKENDISILARALNHYMITTPVTGFDIDDWMHLQRIYRRLWKELEEEGLKEKKGLKKGPLFDK